MTPTIIVLLSCFLLLSSRSPILIRASFNLTLPDPEAVVLQLQRRVNASMSRRQMAGVGKSDQAPAFSSKCLTGNPIDDCWRCDPGWPDNRQRLADCGLGFGARAYGGKGGQIYTVTDSSDENVANPPPGTLRHAVIQTEPLWIVFSGDMTIRLRHELIMNSFKTIDGRGADVHVFGGGCITVQDVTNIIIHNLHVHDCVPSGNTEIRSTPTHVGYRGRSDGDGISIFHSRDVWIDHCSLAHCADGLVDAIMGSTGISITNSYFAHHDEVMLLGHKDGYAPDSGMQVTIAFNVFGQGLVQRMPRCRQGYIHIVNNDFTQWQMYAIGGSASPTINSQGNRYSAPTDANAKEVTKRVDTDEKDWTAWNWRSDGDKMVNGAFFVPSGEGANNLYAKAESLEPKSPLLIDQITMNAGVFGSPRDNGGISASGGSQTTGGGGGGGDGNLFGMIFGNDAPPRRPVSPALCSALVSILIVQALIRCSTPHPGRLWF